MVDVVEGETLRDHLVAAVGGLPEFSAWQFVEAAIEALDDADTPRTPLCPCREPPPISSDRTDCARRRSARRPSAPRAARYARTAPLAGRIPTLAQLDTRTDEREPRGHDRAAPHADLPPRPSPLLTDRFARGPGPPPGTNRRSRPGCNAVHRYCRRDRRGRRPDRPPQPKEPLLDARLPPSPLSHEYRQPPSHRNPAAACRAPNAPPSSNGPARTPDTDDDYRPVASAMDEAQVAIIPVGTKSVAETPAPTAAPGRRPGSRTRHAPLPHRPRRRITGVRSRPHAAARNRLSANRCGVPRARRVR